MALSPELLKRRQRTQMPRAPPRTLGSPVNGADEELTTLLTQLLDEARKDTLFTLTLERDRLFSALYYAGFVAAAWANIEIQLGPLAATTVYLPVPPGMVLVPRELTATISLPWWLSSSTWIDTEPPALPAFVLLRCPESYQFSFKGIVPIRRYVRFTVINNHVVNTVNFCAITELAFMPEASWKMLEVIYLKPIAEYAQQKAEESTGRPYP